MKVIKGKALAIRVRDPHRVTEAIRQSHYRRKIDDENHEVIVHWTLQNVRYLANLGIKNPPSPILRDYDWPGSMTPYKHQLMTASFLSANNRAYCFSEQGTGKTASVLWAVDYLMKIGDVKKVLVVCPLSIMKSAWLDDAFSVCMHRRAAVAHGTPKQRRKIIEGDYEITIINYDGLGTVQKELKAAKYDLVVADEATFIKNAQTDRWKKFASIVTPATKIWALTGTPAAQSPLDAFGLAKMVTPHRVPNYFTRWRDKVMIKVSQFTWAPKPKATQIVNHALKPAIRFTKAQCLDLPPVTYVSQEVQMTSQQEKYYKALKSQALIEAAGSQVTAVHAAAALNKLLQLSCGAVYSDDGEVIQFNAKNRLRVMLDVIEASSHKVIVFVPFRHAIDICKEYIEANGYSVEVISGAVSANNRSRIISDFQNKPDPHVLVIQPQSAAHGVTLTAANTICWFGPIPSVETWLQANERINRPSQENKMTVVKLFGSDVEKRVYSVLESKEQDQRKLVSLYENLLNEA